MKAAVASAGMAVPIYVPASALGRDRKLPASERITLGMIGVGGMGSAHLNFFRSNPRVEILAVCDVDEKKRLEAQKAVGEGCAAYTDFRELLDRKDIDAVVIATPDHWHTLIAIYACQAGKDIYCEKPLTLTIDEATKLVKNVRRYGRIFQTGSQQRSSREFQHACSIVRSGRIGKIKEIRVGIDSGPVSDWSPNEPPPPGLDWDLWLGPAPRVPFNRLRHPYSFRWFYDYSGGKLTDWGAHHNDIVQWALDKDGTGPVKIKGDATFPTKGLFDTAVDFEIAYTYATGERAICHSESNGVEFTGSDGTVYVERGFMKTEPACLMEDPLGPGDTSLFQNVGHQDNWLDCIKSRKKPICDVGIGAGSVILCHLCNIAIRTGRKLEWNPDACAFIGDEVANRMISRPYRAPWRI